MPIASHYVFMDLDEMIKNERYTKLEKINKKYCERYSNDGELQRACGTISTLLASKDYEGLETMRDDLRKLVASRKIQSSGGTKMWFNSRR